MWHLKYAALFLGVYHLVESFLEKESPMLYIGGHNLKVQRKKLGEATLKQVRMLCIPLQKDMGHLKLIQIC